MSQNAYPLTSLGLQARDHWRKYRPTMYRDLKRQGKLDQALYAAQELTAKALADALSQGLPYNQAWELVREEWIYLPDEEDVPELGCDPASLTPPAPAEYPPEEFDSSPSPERRAERER